MLGEVRQDLSPDIAVVSTLLVLATAILIGILSVLRKETAQ
jgi:putative spermidine/putrescine transport system permease protein